MTPDTITKAIREAITTRVEEIAKEEIHLAKVRLEERTRDLVATVATRIFNNVSIERAYGHDLRIIIEFKTGDKNI